PPAARRGCSGGAVRRALNCAVDPGGRVSVRPATAPAGPSTARKPTPGPPSTPTISPLLLPMRFRPWGPRVFASTEGVRWSYAPNDVGIAFGVLVLQAPVESRDQVRDLLRDLRNVDYLWGRSRYPVL